jgi:hypothetical protein
MERDRICSEFKRWKEQEYAVSVGDGKTEDIKFK